MNDHCRGQWFTVGDDRFYRCARDGAVAKHDLCPIQVSTCLNCNRTINGTNHGEVETVTKTLIQAKLPIKQPAREESDYLFVTISHEKDDQTNLTE